MTSPFSDTTAMTTTMTTLTTLNRAAAKALAQWLRKALQHGRGRCDVSGGTLAATDGRIAVVLPGESDRDPCTTALPVEVWSAAAWSRGKLTDSVGINVDDTGAVSLSSDTGSVVPVAGARADGRSETMNTAQMVEQVTPGRDAGTTARLGIDYLIRALTILRAAGATGVDLQVASPDQPLVIRGIESHLTRDSKEVGMAVVMPVVET
jgi:hypothetical protein